MNKCLHVLVKNKNGDSNNMVLPSPKNLWLGKYFFGNDNIDYEILHK